MAGKKAAEVTENIKIEDTKEASLEENFVRLEETISRLEEEELSLEDAFRAYSEGMQLLKKCNVQIDRVEKEVLKLTEEGSLEPLDAESYKE